jgi:hypothetical protein
MKPELKRFMRRYTVSHNGIGRIMKEMSKVLQSHNKAKSGKHRAGCLFLAECSGSRGTDGDWNVVIQFSNMGKWLRIIDCKTSKCIKFQRYPTRDHRKLMRLIKKHEVR